MEGGFCKIFGGSGRYGSCPSSISCGSHAGQGDERSDLESGLFASFEKRSNIHFRSLYWPFMVKHDPLLPHLHVYLRTDPLIPLEPLWELLAGVLLDSSQAQGAASSVSSRWTGHPTACATCTTATNSALGSFLAAAAATENMQDGSAALAPPRGHSVAADKTHPQNKL
jgi:hypothetical protein